MAESTGEISDPDLFRDVPVVVAVVVGTAHPSVHQLLELKQGSVLPLQNRIDEPVVLRVGDRVIARGELQEDSEDPGRLLVRILSVGPDAAAG